MPSLSEEEIMQKYRIEKRERMRVRETWTLVCVRVAMSASVEHCAAERVNGEVARLAAASVNSIKQTSRVRARYQRHQCCRYH